MLSYLQFVQMAAGRRSPITTDLGSYLKDSWILDSTSFSCFFLSSSSSIFDLSSWFNLSTFCRTTSQASSTSFKFRLFPWRLWKRSRTDTISCHLLNQAALTRKAKRATKLTFQIQNSKHLWLLGDNNETDKCHIATAIEHFHKWRWISFEFVLIRPTDLISNKYSF